MLRMDLCRFSAVDLPLNKTVYPVLILIYPLPTYTVRVHHKHVLWYFFGSGMLLKKSK